MIQRIPMGEMPSREWLSEKWADVPIETTVVEKVHNLEKAVRVAITAEEVVEFAKDLKRIGEHRAKFNESFLNWCEGKLSPSESEKCMERVLFSLFPQIWEDGVYCNERLLNSGLDKDVYNCDVDIRYKFLEICAETLFLPKTGIAKFCQRLAYHCLGPQVEEDIFEAFFVAFWLRRGLFYCSSYASKGDWERLFRVPVMVTGREIINLTSWAEIMLSSALSGARVSFTDIDISSIHNNWFVCPETIIIFDLLLGLMRQFGVEENFWGSQWRNLPVSDSDDEKFRVDVRISEGFLKHQLYGSGGMSWAAKEIDMGMLNKVVGTLKKRRENARWRIRRRKERIGAFQGIDGVNTFLPGYIEASDMRCFLDLLRNIGVVMVRGDLSWEEKYSILFSDIFEYEVMRIGVVPHWREVYRTCEWDVKTRFRFLVDVARCLSDMFEERHPGKLELVEEYNAEIETLWMICGRM